MSDRRFDGIELIEWADKYGHPEEWAKKAQDLHAKNERLAGELAQVKAERDEWRSDFRELGAKMAQAVSLSQVIEAERDTALRELEVEQAVAAGALHRLDLVVNGEGTFQPTVDAFAEARAFLLSMREKADQ